MVQTFDLTRKIVADRDLVLNRFNDTRSVYPGRQTIIDLFEEQVKKTPGAIAVIEHNAQLTYSQLNTEANKLAHYLLRRYALSKDEVVGILVPRSVKYLICMLAVLKAGAAFLPVDHYPVDRIAYIIENSKLKLLIHNGNTLFNNRGAQLVNINTLQLDNEISEDPQLHQSPDDLACVMYASGFNSKPSGVMLEHRGCINMALDQARMFDITGRDRVAWLSPVTSGVSLSAILVTLLSGAALQVYNEDVMHLQHTDATVAMLPPNAQSLPVKEITGLKCIITAGGAGYVQTAAQFSGNTRHFNTYGPTECSACVTAYKLTPADAAKTMVPIGRPLANLSVYILDNNLQPVPVGVEGKIYVAGIGLARGYLNNPLLTAERFIPCPFQHGQRMYCTGDSGRWLHDGNIELTLEHFS